MQQSCLNLTFLFSDLLTSVELTIVIACSFLVRRVFCWVSISQVRPGVWRIVPFCRCRLTIVPIAQTPKLRGAELDRVSLLSLFHSFVALSKSGSASSYFLLSQQRTAQRRIAVEQQQNCPLCLSRESLMNKIRCQV